MAYDMNDRTTRRRPPPWRGGFTDTEALQEFTAVVPRQKVILGVPFYGYDWPTNGRDLGARRPVRESPLSDGLIAASATPPTGTRRPKRRGPPTWWAPSGTRRSSTTRPRWP